MPTNVSQRVEMIRLLTCDLCDRVKKHEKQCKKSGHYMWAGYDFGRGDGISKTQLHADIVQLRRMLTLLDKEVCDAD